MLCLDASRQMIVENVNKAIGSQFHHKRMVSTIKILKGVLFININITVCLIIIV